ncbi:zinc-binding alcohol dehydrogenase family protein [Lactiplantibacillus herbarum]|uniref:zinc-binding alcohol dehydrogenase family protein n=1 Tax=Lactiplantibacillus herbarum TaxID=1670446 RepID=UPI00064F694E|nr:zinc-binding alcohol dehydrogenase family protein [Lactiplantibacillus herbarum]
MKAIGFTAHLPIDDPKSLVDLSVAIPEVRGHDLLVETEAVSVNPVDIGVRSGGHGTLAQPKIIGWDAYGVVSQVGGQVTLFKPGDAVFYAGSFKRPGSDSAYQLVDERIVGHAPTELSPEASAAMPLTSLTAYEALFEQLAIPFDPQHLEDDQNQGKTILIISGAGGVGSIATQLAKLAGLTVIATASRPASVQWVKDHGADVVVNHRLDLVSEVKQAGYHDVDYLLGLNDLDGHWKEMCELIKPAGHIASITENKHPIDLKRLTKKRGTFSWEWMYSKSYYHTADMISQHTILDTIARLLDEGKLESTLTKTLTPLNAENLRQAHAMIESHHMIGKVVVKDWPTEND